MIEFSKFVTKSALLVLLATVSQISGAYAAESGEPRLEEVVVTATKRATSIKDIPMSVEVVTGKAIQNRGIANMEQLAADVPNFHVGDGLLTTIIAVRGLGSQPERAFEQSVGMFIDGIYMPRSRQYRSPFMDVSRIEILRGPQSVLFGLNSTAGAVSVISNSSQPGDHFELATTISHEIEYGGNTFGVVVGGSPSDSLGLRLAAKYRNDDEGMYKNTFNGKDEGAPEETVLRATAVWQASDKTNLNIKLNYADFGYVGDVGEEFGPPFVLDNNGLSNGNTERELNFTRNMDAAGGDILRSNGYTDRSTAGHDQESLSLAATLSHEIGDHTLTAIAGYTDLDWDSLRDLDFGPALMMTGSLRESFEQQNIELRVASPTDGVFSWIVGAYYQDVSLDNWNSFILGTAWTDPFGLSAVGDIVTPAVYLDLTMGHDVRSLSAYGTASWNVSDSVKVTAGARWADTDTDYYRSDDSACRTLDEAIVPQALIDSSPGFFFCFTALGYKDSRQTDNLMPELAIQWNTSDDVMLFAKVSESAKAGGFGFGTNLRIDPVTGRPFVEYDDEKALGIEAGMKSRLLDGAAELNVTIFQTDFEDLQVNTFDPATSLSFIANAAKVSSKGIEVDGRWRVNERLIVSGSVAFLDSKFDSFDNSPCAVDGSVPTSLTGACDATGLPTAYAPDYSGFFGADLNVPLTDSVDFVGGLYLSFSDSYLTDSSLAKVFEQDAYSKIDARIGIEAPDARWGIYLIGNNLSDEIILNNSQVFLGDGGYAKAPRTVTLQGTYRVGD